jgi:hypothetical protein
MAAAASSSGGDDGHATVAAVQFAPKVVQNGKSADSLTAKNDLKPEFLFCT